MSSPAAHPSPQGPSTRTPTAAATAWVVLAALVGAAAIAFLGLRDFSFNDYEVEALPAIDRLLAGDLSGFAAALPGYGGALVLQGPLAFAGDRVGPDHDLWAWRAQALPGMLLLVGLGIHLGRRVSVAVPGRAGVAWAAVTALLIAGAPFAALAQETGHTEELLVAGLAVAAVLRASHGHVVSAAVLIGLAAAAKPWAVIGVPVVLLAATDLRVLLRATAACVVCGALLMTPAALSGGATKVTQATHTTTSGIFKPDNVFWFAGEQNPSWGAIQANGTVTSFQRDATQAGWAQRLEPAWAARVSHPAIVAFAILLAAAFWWRRGRGARADLLLLLSAVCWWRCLLDTWNVHYYALGALLALAAWEARRGRPPVVTCVVTTLAWTTFQIFPASKITPDLHTALYLAWALPLGVAMVARLLAPAASIELAARLGRRLEVRLPTLARAVGARPPVA